MSFIDRVGRNTCEEPQKMVALKEQKHCQVLPRSLDILCLGAIV